MTSFFAVLRPTRLEGHQQHLDDGRDHGVKSEDLIDLDEPEPAPRSISPDQVVDLIDLDEPEPAPRSKKPHQMEDLIDLDEPAPPRVSTLRPVNSIPIAATPTPRRMFGDRELGELVNHAESMEVVEHHTEAPICKPDDEDLIDFHPDRKNAIMQGQPMSLLDLDEPRRKFEGLALTRGAPRAPQAMLETITTVTNVPNTTPFVPARPFKAPTGPSRQLRRSDPRAHQIFLAQQEYWEAERRARIRYEAALYYDWDDMGDRRRGFRGGGGGDRYNGGGYGGRDRRGGGGGGMKRRYDDEDDYGRQEYRERRPYPSVQIRNAIIAIADDPERDPAEDVPQIAKMIEQYQDERDVVETVTQMVPRMVIEQPFKTPHVAAIVLHLNQKKPDIVKQILESTGVQAQAAMDSGEWRSLKLLLKFFACTHGLFEGDGIFTVLAELFDRAVDLQAASTEDAFGIELVKIIMLTLPYIMASSATDLRAKVEALLEKTGLVASAELDAERIYNPYVSTADQEAVQLPKLITLLQTQLQNESEIDWPLAFIPKLYKPQQVQETGEDAAQKHAFPALVVPAVVTPGPRPLFLELFLSIYAHQGTETVPPFSNLASSLIRDALVDTINILDFNREAVTRILIDIDQYLAPGIFAKRGTPYHKVEEEGAQGMPTWKPEDMAVDAIFSQLLQLPAPEHKLVYYHSIITHACKISPNAFAPVLGRAIRFLYRSLETLDLELVARFTDWFAHHLSNYDFRWKWDEWVDDVDLPSFHPKQAFIRGALSKEIRLSFAKRIRDGVPQLYHKLIPETMDNDIPNFKYNNSATPFAPEALQILTSLRKKSPDSDLDPILTAITTQAASITTATNPTLPAIDAYVTTLCYIGSKSLSHVLTFIERSQTRLLSFSRDAEDPAMADASRVQIVESVVAYWRETQTGVAVSIVDKLLNYGIVSPRSVVAWALGTSAVIGSSDPNDASYPRRTVDPRTALPESWIYELLASTLSKVSSRVREIAAARAKPALPPSQASALETALDQETAEMSALFQVVDDALQSAAMGSDDVMIEAGVGDEGNDAPGVMAGMKEWGGKWVRVFGRKRAVEEVWVVEARKTFPEPGVEPEPEPEPQPEAEAAEEVEMKDGDADEVVNGEPAVNGNGASNSGTGGAAAEAEPEISLLD